MENENNPWLEITKQPVSNNPQKPGLNGIRFTIPIDNFYTDGTVFSIEAWDAATPKFNPSTITGPIIFGTAGEGFKPPEDEYSQEDLDEAGNIIVEYLECVDDPESSIDDFTKILWDRQSMDYDDARSIYYFLNDKFVYRKSDLIDFMYENHIWD